jgi:hypothetical protein
LTFKNIRSAFTTPGIFPLNTKKVLDQIKIKTPSPISSNNKRKKITPGSVRGLRRVVKAISKEEEDFALKLDLLIRASEKLVV